MYVHHSAIYSAEKSEFKKSLGGKTLIKNFSRSNVVLVTTISPSKAMCEMIVYIFLLPGKNDIFKPRSNEVL